MAYNEKERLQELSKAVTDFAFNYMQQFDEKEYDELMRAAILILKPLKKNVSEIKSGTEAYEEKHGHSPYREDNKIENI